jgi:hypothetical protein
MGADCSVDRKENASPDKLEKLNSKSEASKCSNLNTSFESHHSSLHDKGVFSLDCKSYKDYNNKIEMIKIKIKEIIKKVEIINDYVPIKRYL